MLITGSYVWWSNAHAAPHVAATVDVPFPCHEVRSMYSSRMKLMGICNFTLMRCFDDALSLSLLY